MPKFVIERERSAEATAENQGALGAREVEQLFRLAHIEIPVERLDTAA